MIITICRPRLLGVSCLLSEISIRVLYSSRHGEVKSSLLSCIIVSKAQPCLMKRSTVNRLVNWQASESDL